MEVANKNAITAEALACPLCNKPLDLNILKCDSCGQTYKTVNGVFDFTPIPPPKLIEQLWGTWVELQKNGEKAYNEWAEASLSIGLTDVEKAFGKYALLQGNVLDVGCGPQAYPGYAFEEKTKINLYGIDPLRGVEKRDFNFVVGLGEYLPFKDFYFDRVIFGTSLDHLFNPVKCLQEARRVLKDTGKVVIWHGLPPEEKKRSRIRKFLGRVKYEIINTIKPTFSYKFYKSLKIPKGAIDHFHFSHPSIEQVTNYLNEAQFENIRVERFRNTRSYFLIASPKRGNNI
jgi:ubiquinone/menaquinone biosynthesis C-methylase UbiE